MSKKYSIAQFADALGKLSKEVRGDALKKAALSGAYIIEANAKMNASGGRPGLNIDTGNLVASINTKVIAASSDTATAEVGTGVEYARVHEYGGVVKPLHAKMLHFTVDGQDVFAKSVTIPARPYMRPAVDDNEADIIKAIETSIANTIEKAI